MPDVINYTEARKNLAATMDKVCDDCDAVIITRRKARPVVMMSLDDYNSLMETAYLLSSPKNAERLMRAIEEDKAGLGKERDLIEE